MIPQLFDFDTAFEKGREDYNNDVTSRVVKIRSKIRFENKTKREAVSALITEMPEDGESLHIVSNGSFDYFTLIPHIVEMCNGLADEFWFSTWTMSRENVIQIVDLFDRGIFRKIFALTGEYFRTREAKVYSLLYDEMKKRGQVFCCNKNHAKVTLLKIGGGYYVIEGSANFTANPRIEQFIISKSKELFDFHKDWMNEVIRKNG